MKKNTKKLWLVIFAMIMFFGGACNTAFALNKNTVFASEKMTVSVSVAQGKGTVLNTGEYEVGTQVTLVAQPEFGYNVLAWMDSANNESYKDTLDITVSSTASENSYKIYFQELKATYTLVNGGNAHCLQNQTQTICKGFEIKPVIIVPDEGYTFTSRTKDVAPGMFSGYGVTASVDLDSDTITLSGKLTGTLTGGATYNIQISDFAYTEAESGHTVRVNTEGSNVTLSQGSASQTVDGTAITPIVLKPNTGYSFASTSADTLNSGVLADSGLSATLSSGEITISGTPNKCVRISAVNDITMTAVLSIGGEITSPTKTTVDSGAYYTPNSYIYYGGYKWRVLDAYKTSDGITSGMFLLSEYLLGTSTFGDNNTYSGSTVQNWCNTTFYNNFNTNEKSAIIKTIKTDSANTTKDWYGKAWDKSELTGDYVFLPSVEEIYNYVASYTEKSESIVSQLITKVNNSNDPGNWWLRSPLNNSTKSGHITSSGSVTDWYLNQPDGMRPAFNLDTSAILFASPVGVKGSVTESSTPTAITTPSNCDYKLTLVDSSRNFTVTTQTALKGEAGDSFEINYENAKYGSEEYISAIILDKNGNATHYGKLLNVASDAYINHAATFVIPSGLEKGEYTLRLFNEQCNADSNGDYKTDYASAFCDIALTVNASEAQIGTQGYDTVAEALEAAQSGETIQIVSENITSVTGGTLKAGVSISSFVYGTDNYSKITATIDSTIDIDIIDSTQRFTCKSGEIQILKGSAYLTGGVTATGVTGRTITNPTENGTKLVAVVVETSDSEDFVIFPGTVKVKIGDVVYENAYGTYYDIGAVPGVAGLILTSSNTTLMMGTVKIGTNGTLTINGNTITNTGDGTFEVGSDGKLTATGDGKIKIGDNEFTVKDGTVLSIDSDGNVTLAEGTVGISDGGKIITSTGLAISNPTDSGSDIVSITKGDSVDTVCVTRGNKVTIGTVEYTIGSNDATFTTDGVNTAILTNGSVVLDNGEAVAVGNNKIENTGSSSITVNANGDGTGNTTIPASGSVKVNGQTITALAETVVEFGGEYSTITSGKCAITGEITIKAKITGTERTATVTIPANKTYTLDIENGTVSGLVRDESLSEETDGDSVTIDGVKYVCNTTTGSSFPLDTQNGNIANIRDEAVVSANTSATITVGTLVVSVSGNQAETIVACYSDGAFVELRAEDDTFTLGSGDNAKTYTSGFYEGEDATAQLIIENTGKVKLMYGIVKLADGQSVIITINEYDKNGKLTKTTEYNIINPENSGNDTLFVDTWNVKVSKDNKVIINDTEYTAKEDGTLLGVNKQGLGLYAGSIILENGCEIKAGGKVVKNTGTDAIIVKANLDEYGDETVSVTVTIPNKNGKVSVAGAEIEALSDNTAFTINYSDGSVSLESGSVKLGANAEITVGNNTIKNTGTEAITISATNGVATLSVETSGGRITVNSGDEVVTAIANTTLQVDSNSNVTLTKGAVTLATNKQITVGKNTVKNTGSSSITVNANGDGTGNTTVPANGSVQVDGQTITALAETVVEFGGEYATISSGKCTITGEATIGAKITGTERTATVTIPANTTYTIDIENGIVSGLKQEQDSVTIDGTITYILIYEHDDVVSFPLDITKAKIVDNTEAMIAKGKSASITISDTGIVVSVTDENVGTTRVYKHVYLSGGTICKNNVVNLSGDTENYQKCDSFKVTVGTNEKSYKVYQGGAGFTLESDGKVTLKSGAVILENGNSIIEHFGNTIKNNGNDSVTVGFNYSEGTDVMVPENGNVEIATATQTSTYKAGQSGTRLFVNSEVVLYEGCIVLANDQEYIKVAQCDASVQLGNNTLEYTAPVVFVDGGNSNQVTVVKSKNGGTVTISKGDHFTVNEAEYTTSLTTETFIITNDGAVIAIGTGIQIEDGKSTTGASGLEISNPTNSGDDRIIVDKDTTNSKDTVTVITSGGTVQIGEEVYETTQGGTTFEVTSNGVTLTKGSVKLNAGKTIIANGKEITNTGNGTIIVDSEGNVTLIDGSFTLGKGEKIYVGKDNTLVENTGNENITVQANKNESGELDGTATVTVPDGGKVTIGETVITDVKGDTIFNIGEVTSSKYSYCGKVKLSENGSVTLNNNGCEVTYKDNGTGNGNFAFYPKTTYWFKGGEVYAGGNISAEINSLTNGAKYKLVIGIPTTFGKYTYTTASNITDGYCGIVTLVGKGDNNNPEVVLKSNYGVDVALKGETTKGTYIAKQEAEIIFAMSEDDTNATKIDLIQTEKVISSTITKNGAIQVNKGVTVTGGSKYITAVEDGTQITLDSEKNAKLVSGIGSTTGKMTATIDDSDVTFEGSNIKYTVNTTNKTLTLNDTGSVTISENIELTGKADDIFTFTLNQNNKVDTITIPEGATVKGSDGYGFTAVAPTEGGKTTKVKIDENFVLTLVAGKGNVTGDATVSVQVTKNGNTETVSVFVPQGKTYTIDADNGVVTGVNSGESVKIGEITYISGRNDGSFSLIENKLENNGDTAIIPNEKSETITLGSDTTTALVVTVSGENQGNTTITKGDSSTIVLGKKGDSFTLGDKTYTAGSDGTEFTIDKNGNVTLTNGTAMLNGGDDVKVGDNEVINTGDSTITVDSDGNVTVPNGGKVQIGGENGTEYQANEDNTIIKATDDDNKLMNGSVKLDKDESITVKDKKIINTGDGIITVGSDGTVISNGDGKVNIDGMTYTTKDNTEIDVSEDDNVLTKGEMTIGDEEGNTINAGGKTIGGKGTTITVTEDGLSGGKITTVSVPNDGERKTTITTTTDGIKDTTTIIGKEDNTQVAVDENGITLTKGTAEVDGNKKIKVVGNTYTTGKNGATIDSNGKLTDGSVSFDKDSKVKVGDNTITNTGDSTITVDSDGNVTVPNGGKVIIGNEDTANGTEYEADEDNTIIKATNDGNKLLSGSIKLGKDKDITVKDKKIENTGDTDQKITVKANEDKTGNPDGTATITVPKSGGKVTIDGKEYDINEDNTIIEVNDDKNKLIKGSVILDKDENITVGENKIESTGNADKTIIVKANEDKTGNPDGTATITIPKSGGKVTLGEGENKTTYTSGSDNTTITVDKDGKVTLIDGTATIDGKKEVKADGNTYTTGDNGATITSNGKLTDGSVEFDKDSKVKVGENDIIVENAGKGKISVDSDGNITVPKGGKVIIGGKEYIATGDEEVKLKIDSDGKVRIIKGATVGTDGTTQIADGGSVTGGTGNTIENSGSGVDPITVITKNDKDYITVSAGGKVKIGDKEYEAGNKETIYVIDKGSNAPNVIVSDKDSSLELVVIKQEQVSEKMKSNVKRDEIASVIYDVSLLKDGVAVTERLDNKLTIRLLIPEEGKTRSFRIIHLHGDNTSAVEYTIEGDYAVFTVDELSEFSIVVDNSGSAWWLILILAIIVAVEIVLIVLKKKKSDKNGKNTVCLSAGVFGGVIPVSEIVLLALFGVTALTLGAYIVYLYIKGKKANTLEVASEMAVETVETEEVETDNEPLDEEENTSEETNNVITARFDYSFTARIILSSDETKRYFVEISNYLLSYKNIKNRMSWKNLSFNYGRTPICRLAMKGKTLWMCLALDPKEFIETKYGGEDFSDSARYKKVPYAIRIKSDRGLKYAKELVDILASRLGIEQGEEVNTYNASEYPFDSQSNLVQRKLIKVYSDKEITSNTKIVKQKFDIHTSVSVSEAKTLIDDSTAKNLVVVENKETSVNKSNESKTKARYAINIDTLSSHFAPEDTVTLTALKEKGLVPKKEQAIKILARGTLDKPLTVIADNFSADAIKMIVLTGGKAIIGNR